MRLTFSLMMLTLVVALAGCSTLWHRSWQDMYVLDRSDYCGTPSEASSVDYFATEPAFRNWILARNIDGFDADDAANGGVIVAEMGQRPTGGYGINLDPDKTRIADDTLIISMTWKAPALNAKVSQALNSRCVVFNPPQGDYSRIKLVDQLGNTRGETTYAPRRTANADSGA